MSFFSNAISWFAHSSALDAAKKAAVQEYTDLAAQLVKKGQELAPDMAGKAEDFITNAVTHAVAGILTRGGK